MSQYASFTSSLRTTLASRPDDYRGIIDLFVNMTYDWSWDDQREMIVASMGINEDIDSYVQSVIEKIEFDEM